MTRIIAALMLLTLAAPAVAADDWIFKPEAEQEREFYTAQFAGWGGIILNCLHHKASEPGKRICGNIKTDAEFLAATAKMPFHSLLGSNSFLVSLARIRKIPDALVLEVNVGTIGTGFIGVTIRFEAGSIYSKAIDKSEKDGPETMPKGGTLVLWSRTVSAMGTDNSELYRDIRSSTETVLKNFFSLFLKYWTKPEELKKKK